ncbi:MFS transporter [Antrihabitans stalactiti]|uniref:MFS transporter n=1 Tax=Antrihabitans stalactiti TaxID=2584121 RepID=UPI003B849B51
MKAIPLTPWRFIVGFGTVSLLADLVYEGARSITGPLLASLGATGLVVGVVTGIGEASALLLRLVSGPLTDRTRAFWAWTIAGYALTVITVPVLGIAGTLWVASALVIAERVGKAVRSPAKDTLLSYASAVAGRGRGFGVHEAMDQIGAVTGPLVVAVMLAVTGGDYGPTLGVLALPGVAVVAMLVWLRGRVPDPSIYEPTLAPKERPTVSGVGDRLPREFWIYSIFTAMTMLGFATFGLISFHLVVADVVSAPMVPVLYIAAMAADAVAALALGFGYDRTGARVLVVLPVLSALVPLLAFSHNIAMVAAGVLIWGCAVGVQESTLRAVVADLVAPQRRATAYGLYAGAIGVGTAVGGALTGWLYEVSVPILIATVIAVQVAAIGVLAGLLGRVRQR